jgi:ribonuclease D
LEIGDNSTVHHLHSVGQRVTMMQNYMDQHPNTVFDTEWARSYINWDRYAN